MKRFGLASTLAGLLMASGAQADCGNVPHKVAAYLAAKPGWHIVQLADLGGDDQAL